MHFPKKNHFKKKIHQFLFDYTVETCVDRFSYKNFNFVKLIFQFVEKCEWNERNPVIFVEFDYFISVWIDYFCLWYFYCLNLLCLSGGLLAEKCNLRKYTLRRLLDLGWRKCVCIWRLQKWLICEIWEFDGMIVLISAIFDEFVAWRYFLN